MECFVIAPCFDGAVEPKELFNRFLKHLLLEINLQLLVHEYNAKIMIEYVTGGENETVIVKFMYR